MTTSIVQHTASVEFFRDSAKPVGKDVLDVGCGDGFASMQFKEAGAARVVGNDLLDQPPDVFAKAGITYFRGTDRQSLGKFNIVWCHHVLEHQERPIDFLTDLGKSIKPNGQLWLTVPNMVDNFNLSPGHVMAYNMPLLIEHLRRAGFDTKTGAYQQCRGHLRAKVSVTPSGEKGEYPMPMTRELDKSGRCNHTTMQMWNWPVKKGPNDPTYEFPFSTFNNKYHGQECIVVGKGPTEFKFEELQDVSCPVFFINDAVCYEDNVLGESFFFAHDATQLVWLPRIKSIAVVPLGDKVVRNRTDPRLTQASRLCIYKWGSFNKSLLNKSRDEIAKLGSLYLNSGTMHALVHFVWYCGFKHIKFIGCDGINNKLLLQSKGMKSGYDPRITNLSKSRSWYQNRKIRQHQDWMCDKLKLTTEYIGTPIFADKLKTTEPIIPRIAHFIWFGGIPSWMKYNIDLFKKHNPEWEVQVHNTLDVLPEELRTVADKCPQSCQKADILRYWVIYEKGGIYIDSDEVVLKSFEPLRRYPIFLPAHPDGRVQNGVFGAIPEHAHLGIVLSEIEHTDHRALKNDRCIFGPTLWTKLRKSLPFEVLPHHYFEPFMVRATAIKFWKSNSTQQLSQLTAIKKRFVDGVWPYTVHLKGSKFANGESPC